MPQKISHAEPEMDEGTLRMSRRPIPLPTILTVFAVAIALATAWKLSFVLLMGFAAILLGIALRKTAGYLQRYLHLSASLSVFIVLGLVVAAISGLVAVAGPQVTDEMRQLLSAIPKAWQQVTSWLNGSTLGSLLVDQVQDSNSTTEEVSSTTKAARAAADSMPGIFGFLRGTLNAVVGGAANIVLILTVAIFLALNPATYVNGALYLVPMGHRHRAAEIMRELGDKLWSWLAGQALDMLIVALATGFGLWMLGIPLALVLGIIAGLTNAIPFLGPFLSGIPAVLFALTQGPKEALYVGILFIVIQQVEGNILMPLIQRRAAGLPPVLTIAAVIGFGVLFGLPGVLVAAPLMLVAMILVQRLYVEGVLGDDLPEHEVQVE